MKDGSTYLKNVRKDLMHYPNRSPLGAVYILDETASTFPRKFRWFNDANRKTKNTVDVVLNAMQEQFAVVEPSCTKNALLRSFQHHGRLDLYGFVVTGPKPTTSDSAASVPLAPK